MMRYLIDLTHAKTLPSWWPGNHLQAVFREGFFLHDFELEECDMPKDICAIFLDNFYVYTGGRKNDIKIGISLINLPAGAVITKLPKLTQVKPKSLKWHLIPAVLLFLIMLALSGCNRLTQEAESGIYTDFSSEQTAEAKQQAKAEKRDYMKCRLELYCTRSEDSKIKKGAFTGIEIYFGTDLDDGLCKKHYQAWGLDYRKPAVERCWKNGDFSDD